MTRPARKPTICDAPGCSVEIQRGKLMCRAHWFGTPAPLRRAISDAWKERRIRDWSANCLNARNYHATTADRTAAMRDRQLGERNDA
jgi:hypothetical protein